MRDIRINSEILNSVCKVVWNYGPYMDWDNDKTAGPYREEFKKRIESGIKEFIRLTYTNVDFKASDYYTGL